MGEVYFYHLRRHPLEAVLPTLVERARSAGWRVAIRGFDEGRMDWLDEKLWLGQGESFLPHGRVGGRYDAVQPVLLTTKAELPNGASCVICIDGAKVTSDEVQKLERVCILFDGNDGSAIQTARNQWRTLTREGCRSQYWSQESGKWRKEAEH